MACDLLLPSEIHRTPPMTFFVLFAAVTLSFLLWSAAFTGIAARVSSMWLRCVLAVLAVVVPACALFPWLVTCFELAFRAKLHVNWFGPMLTVFISSLVGGLCILRGGLTSPDTDAAPLRAQRWPVISLFLAFLLSKIVVIGILFTLDSRASARIDAMKRESADLMASVLIPEVSDLSNAAPFYKAAYQIIDADSELGTVFDKLETIDPTAASVEDTLARHHQTLLLVQDGAKQDVYREVRDWTRPSFDLLLPELQSLRSLSKLVYLSARNKAAKDDIAGALDDVWMLYRIRQHAASEPFLVSGLVGAAIDRFALNAFTEVLPHADENDLSLLQRVECRELITMTPSFKRHLFAEEAFGIMTYANFCTGSFAMSDLDTDFENRLTYPYSYPLIYRVFLFDRDYELYRSTMHSYQQLLVISEPYDNVIRQTKALEEKLSQSKTGILAGLLTPSLSGVFKAGVRSNALHKAVAVALATTLYRIRTGDIPATLTDLLPDELPVMPLDPYTHDAPMRLTVLDDTVVIYSVGPDGKDNGGPPAVESDRTGKNDDVGLWLHFKK